MCIRSPPSQPPRCSYLSVTPTPPTLQPLSFTSEPLITLNDLMSSPVIPAVTIPELAGPTQHSSQQPIHHAQSDCGHYGSPQVNRSHSLLRNFSLRSRNSFSLRTRQSQRHCPPTSLSAPKPGIVRTSSTSASTASGSSLLSVWKKWRVRSVTVFSTTVPSTLDGQDGELDAIPAISRPQGPARKRSLFLPVGRLIAPFQIPSSSLSSDSPCVIIPQSPSIPLIQQESVRVSNLGAIQDEDDNSKVNGDSNPSSCFADGDELIRQMGGRVPDVMESQTHCKTDSELEFKSTAPDMAPPLQSPSLRSPPPLTLSSLNSFPSSSPPLLTPSSPLSSPPFSPLPSSSPQTNLSTSPPLPALQHPPSSSSPNVTSGVSTPESSSNPNLKLSISQRRRAKFTLGDGSDLDCDSLAVSGAVARAPGLNVETGVEPMVLPNDSTQPTDPMLTPHDKFINEYRDQIDTTSASSAGIAIATTTNGKSARRWTLSSALTDEGISDEGLVKELERMREVVEWDCAPIDKDGHDFLSSSPPPSPSNPSDPWLITQRALLTTRELILTERHYLSSLLLLLCSDSTLTPVPEMMVSHAKELIDVSKRLLKGMEGEPSARGVAEVFVEVGGGLGVNGAEDAFVGWCSAVGGWFQDDLPDTQAVVDVKKKRKGCESGGGSGEYPSMIAEYEGSGPDGVTFPTTNEHAHTSPLMRTVSTWRKSMPSVTGLGEVGVWRRDSKDKDEGGSTCGRGRIAFDEVQSSSPTSMTSTSVVKPTRKLAVRDLAILPTQRVTRYVLLYRDLLANTPPSSSSHPIVERAVEAACRIAEKCNRAQGNAAFVAGATRDSSSSSGSSTSMLNRSSSRRRLFSGKRVMTAPEPNLKSKSGHGSTRQSSSSTTSSPTKSHFLLSSSPVSTSPSTSSLLTPTPSSLSRPGSPNNNRIVTNPPLPPPPPSSFNSKIPVASSRQSFGSSTFAGSCTSTTTTTSGTFSSSSSSSSSSSFPFLSTPPPPLFLPKFTSSSSSNVSMRVPRPLSLMSLGNGLRSMSGPVVTDGTGSTNSVTVSTKGFASAIPTKIKV